MTKRRFDDTEVTEIFERATESEGPRSSPMAPSEVGLTLAELQEIGSEVGIPASRIAEAARTVAEHRAGTVTRISRRFLGLPLGVSRTVSLERAMTEEEWIRLVVDLRATFGAEGRVTMQGPLRSWSNGNLQVHVEPHEDRYRVRMGTFKGNAAPIAFAGLMLIVTSVVVLALGSLGAEGTGELAKGVILGIMGLGPFGYLAATLPGWARTRASQVEGLAERISLLMGGDNTLHPDE